MNKNTAPQGTQVDFKEQTPEMRIGEPEFSENYREALLDGDRDAGSEFSLNTTCDD